MARACQTCTLWGLVKFVTIAVVLVTLSLVTPPTAQAQLSSNFYDSSCPGLQATVRAGVQNALRGDGRIGASLVRLFFHDCFVQGCDASILLDDTSTFTGEQNAGPNANSLRGFNVIANIKSAVEAICSGTVSCADILALAARDGVVAAGGPSWTVLLGRRDSTTASLSGANNLPSPGSGIATLTGQFGAVGLNQIDMVALVGAHTFGEARCSSFINRLYNFNGVSGAVDPTINPTFASALQRACPQNGNGNALVDLDVTSPRSFDNSYYLNLPQGQGLLSSDELLQTSASSTTGFVNNFGGNQNAFFAQFTSSMVKMGNISPLTGSAGEIRTTCSKTN